MAFLHQCLLACCFLVLATSQKLIENLEEDVANGYQTRHKSVRVSEQCGNEILGDTLGVIEYKLEEPLQANERCVWLIRVENASAYSVAIFSLGFPDSNANHKLTLTTFSVDGPAENTIINKTGLLNLHGPVLAVTLHTGNSNIMNYTGFTLSYDTHFEDNSSSVSSTYGDLFLNATEDTRTYLGAGSGLNLNSLNFVFITWGATNSFNPQNRLKLAYGQGQRWTSTNFIDAYIYDPLLSWNLFTTFDSGDEFQIFEASDLILLVGRAKNTDVHTFLYYVGNFFCKDDQIE